MKILLLVTIGLTFTLISNAQSIVNYSYDLSGNRIYRGLIRIESARKTKITDTTSYANDANEKVPLEEDKSIKEIKIFPNPTSGELKIEILGFDPEQSSEAYIFNLSGSLIVAKKPLTGNDILDISGCPVGNYVMKVILGKDTYEWKVIKE